MHVAQQKIDLSLLQFKRGLFVYVLTRDNLANIQIFLLYCDQVERT